MKVHKHTDTLPDKEQLCVIKDKAGETHPAKFDGRVFEVPTENGWETPNVIVVSWCSFNDWVNANEQERAML